MADEHEMGVHLPQPRQHGHALHRNDVGARRTVDRTLAAHGGDFLAFDEDDAVMNRRAAVPIDERAAHERRARLAGGAGGEEQQD